MEKMLILLKYPFELIHLFYFILLRTIGYNIKVGIPKKIKKEIK